MEFSIWISKICHIFSVNLKCKEFVYYVILKIDNGHDEQTKFGHNYRKIQVGDDYCIVASASPSCFEAHVGLFKLLMKGIFDKKLIF